MLTKNSSILYKGHFIPNFLLKNYEQAPKSEVVRQHNRLE
jgi:hypothetical protein